MNAMLKILLTVIPLLVLFFPLFPLPVKLRRVSTFHALRYNAPHNKLNFFFILAVLVEFVLVIALYWLVFDIADLIAYIPFVDDLLQSASPSLQYGSNVVVRVLLLNFLTIYALVFLKGVFKAFVDAIFGLNPKKEKKKKKRKEKVKKEKTESEEENKKENKGGKDQKRRIPFFFHSRKKESASGKKEEETQGKEKTKEEKAKTVWNPEDHPILNRIKCAFLGLFFEAPDYRYAHKWVYRVFSVLQFFVYFVEILYFAVFFGMLLGVFFSLPAFIYTILNFFTMRMYIYPFISVIFLQEICNFLHAEVRKEETGHEAVEKAEEEKEEEKRAKLENLRAGLLRRFATEHNIRYFPETPAKKIPPYTYSNPTYKDALQYIHEEMKRQYGSVVQNYMEGLDAVFNGRHVYFGASFYSQVGEYIVSYTYIRLLAGERQIFIVSDRSKVKSLEKYIGRRLTEMTGARNENTWRVYSAGANINEADVLIAVPEDFATDNLVENYPAFFEEACNAVFIDADRILNLNSYLCTVMASRLFVATNRRIRFLFLSRDILQGFTASLQKFFCIGEDIVECNSAAENESVSYMLWNRETDIVYHRAGQSLTTLEGMIAEAAYHADVDGIRILTSVPLTAAEKEDFVTHRVEINEFHKEVPQVNYMICTDDRCNLAAALYAYTRFHGKRASVLHILSRPYLLREYFTDRVEEYVNRSAFIKPMVTEHAEKEKLQLLRLLCDATSNPGGMSQSYFEGRIDEAMKKKGLPVAADLDARVAFLIEELTGDSMLGFRYDGEEDFVTLEEAMAPDISDDESERGPLHTVAREPANEYYGPVTPESVSGYQLKKEMHITFLKLDDIFSKLLRYNERVSLLLHGNVIGKLDTFPERVYQQYLPGQSIIYDNCEYEIESIADDKRTITLRQKNTTDNTCLDTALLRRYKVGTPENMDVLPGVRYYTTGVLEQISVTYQTAPIYGETYGFLNLMANCQTLDFVKGAVGNPRLEDRVVKKQARDLEKGLLLSVRLTSREEVKDGVRKLLSAVFNEFVRTMFPDAFRCIAVCPVLLETPVPEEIEDAYLSRVEALYPHITPDSGVKADKNSVELLILNDAVEDIGVLDRLYDGAGRVMEEQFSHIIDYLKWLKNNPKLPDGQSHYIYFGAEELPSVYDIDGCIRLLENCVRRFSDEETKGIGDKQAAPELCAFCHKPLVKGRFSNFSEHRYICFDCETTSILDDESLASLAEEVREYWASKFPAEEIPEGVTVAADDVYELPEGKVQSSCYYKVDPDKKLILVEGDNPKNNSFVSVLRGYLAIWQQQNDLITPQAEAVLTYEELCFLEKEGKADTVAWIRENLETYVADMLTELETFLEKDPSATSFDFLRSTAISDDGSDDDIEPTPEDVTAGETGGLDSLYDPDRVPRFWKRYLRRRPDDEDSTGAIREEDDDKDIVEEREDDTDGGEGDAAATKADKDEATAKKERKGFLAKQKTGAELIPYEPEEDVNPRIRLYNEIARHVADYSREAFSIEGLDGDTVKNIFYYVMFDYPEFFWMRWFDFPSAGKMRILFRCTNSDGSVNVAMVQKNRSELRRNVKFFTKGITKKTKPYDAMMTIYRRLILNLDYDGVMLAHEKDNNSPIFNNLRNEDTLRSLHSALVEKKVVCVGYAVAMQYLLQSVGICCGQVVSETHSWNVIKFGKYCYFLDATWGDPSNTKRGEKSKNRIRYAYCCVPAKENLGTNDAKTRAPLADVFRELEEFRATRHEYCRVHGGYLTTYNEDKLAELFAKVAKEKTFEGATPCVALRCADKDVFHLVQKRLWTENGIFSVAAKAKALLGSKDKKAAKILGGTWSGNFDEKSLTIHIYPAFD